MVLEILLGDVGRLDLVDFLLTWRGGGGLFSLLEQELCECVSGSQSVIVGQDICKQGTV